MAENVKQNDAKENNGFSMENIVTTALQIPGIKVNRNQLLADYFKNQNDASIEDVLTKGPIEAGCSKETLSKIADKVIFVKNSIVFNGLVCCRYSGWTCNGCYSTR